MRHLLPLWMTISLLLIAVFGLEVLFPVSAMTTTGHVSVDGLLAFGAEDWALVVGQGQWWRMVTGGFLHLSLEHLLANVACLTVIGWVLEGLTGPAWFGAVLATSSMAGSAAALMNNPPDRLTVGVSDGTTGLFAAGLVISLHYPIGVTRYVLQVVALLGLAAALIPVSRPAGDFVVGYVAHDAGAACGLAMGLLMLISWPEGKPHPRFTVVAGSVAASYLALATIAVLPAFANYHDASNRRQFFDPFPDGFEEALAQAPAMVAAKPHDPRARFAHALTFERAGDYPAAAAELSKALAEKDLLAYLDPPHYENKLRVELGRILDHEHRTTDARLVAAPACVTEPVGRLHDLLIGSRLCP